MTQQETSSDEAGAALTLEGRVHIFPDRPLPQFNTTGATAYAALYRGDATKELVAFVCDKGVLPRVDVLNSIRMLDSPVFVRLREAGVIAWPSHGAQYFVLIYEMPQADQYWKTIQETHPIMSEDAVNRYFLEPMIRLLADFQRMGVVHGGIRPTNIYWRDGSTTAPQLGEGFSGSAGLDQPRVFEPVERALCLPACRGQGWHTDDCYAFGVTLAFVVLGMNPVHGLSDADVLRLKMEKGSFNTFVGSRRLSPSHIELLRGLLADDAHQRWTSEDLEQWLSGRRLTPKSSDVGRRSSRHFSFAGHDFWQLRPLADAMSRNVPEAVKIIENGSLEKWVTRSFGDEERAKSLGDAIEQLKEAGGVAHYQDQIVTRACIALDPSGPIRYRGVAVMPSGISTMLADAMLTGENLQVLSEIIAAQFVTLWVNMQKDSRVDIIPLAQQVERVRGIIERSSFGNGVERAAYEMNPGLPCRSPMFKQECVLSIKQILPALERVAASGTHATDPIDRHIAAFIVVRDKRSEAIFASMGAHEKPTRRTLAMLSVLADLQHRFGPDRLPHIAGWILPLLEPCVKRFLNRPLQEKVRKQVKDATSQGNLPLLLRRIDDPKRVIGDEEDFLNARLMYYNIRSEMATIESEIRNKNVLARETGRPVAATFASVVALILISLTLGRAMLHGMLG